MTCRKQQTKGSILKRDKGEVSGDTWARAGLVGASVEGRTAGAAGPPQLDAAGEETHWEHIPAQHQKRHMTHTHTCTHAGISCAQAAICKTSFLVLISASSVVWLGLWSHTHAQKHSHTAHHFLTVQNRERLSAICYVPWRTLSSEKHI